MNVIKNIKLLKDTVGLDQLVKLEAGASMYLRHSRVEFKILSVEGRTITVRCVQSKSPAENYLSQKDLIARTKDLFNQVLPDYDIQVHAIEYTTSVVEVVTPDWIKQMMLDKKVSLKTIVADTGIDKTSLSALVNGLKPLSQSMKAMFYYYFINKELEIKTIDSAIKRLNQADSESLVSILNKKSIEDIRKILKKVSEEKKTKIERQ